METLDRKSAIKGGEFLLRESGAEDVFTPEGWSEEQQMIAQTCKDFLDAEILSRLDEIDSMQHPELVPGLLDKAGELGLLGASVPENYGGFGMDFNTSMLIAEVMGRGHSFAVSISAHTGIGTLPVLYYGTEKQKRKYLPKLCSGEWKASYCLTEPDSGSDANAAKTKAVLSDDGSHYLLNGQKMWITNGGFADVFIVFAKIEDDKVLSAFVVEKEFGGITMNEEEQKMGIKGSSTRQIFFNDCRVPVGNLLGEREQGLRIALNILNIGRIKLGISAVGAAKSALDHAIQYAGERKQFGKTIGSFGAIKHKIGDVAAMIYASETAHYRAGQNIDDAYGAMISSGMGEADAKLKSTEQFAIECAILKVHGSETLDYAVDEGVQIYGGMGFSAEGPMDRAYRDARINRIFEGTNEINRLLCIDMILKRAMKGELDLMGPAAAVAKELTSIPDFGERANGAPFSREKKVLGNLKKAGLMIAGAAVQKFMAGLSEQQEILMHLADILIQCYVAESAMLRAEKVQGLRDEKTFALHRDMAMVTLHRAVEESRLAGRQSIYAFAEGDDLKMMLIGLKRFTRIEPFNLMAARRRIADYFMARRAFVL